MLSVMINIVDLFQIHYVEDNNIVQLLSDRKPNKTLRFAHEYLATQANASKSQINSASTEKH